MQTNTQDEIFNILTDGSANQGIYLSNGYLYINAGMIRTGDLSIGGTSQGANANGKIKIYNSSNQLIGQWDKNGFIVKTGTDDGYHPYFSVGSNGHVTTNSAKIGPFWVYAINYGDPSELDEVVEALYGGGKVATTGDVDSDYYKDRTGICFDADGNIVLTSQQSKTFKV